MEHRLSFALHTAFQEEGFLQKLSLSPEELSHILSGVSWETADDLLPITRRLTCAEALPLFRPLMEAIAPEPEGGWLPYAYRVAVSALYPRGEEPSAQRDAALCLLQGLQVLLDAERRALPFDPFLDFAFCSPEELKDRGTAAEYRRFLRHFREEYVYEMLRLGREVTPFLTLEHIAGVHHAAMSVSRAFKASGGLIDLGVMSGAAAAHDLGKFGCRPGERVPYLHYFYTDLWCQQTNLPTIGRIAANHSVWDLEIENLSSESLVLVYADFRVKQTRDEAGREIPQIFSLRDAFSVILSKLDNVDTTKRRRYEFVYAKLLDFEEYLVYSGVDTTLTTPGLPPLPSRDPALLDLRRWCAPCATLLWTTTSASCTVWAMSGSLRTFWRPPGAKRTRTASGPTCPFSRSISPTGASSRRSRRWNFCTTCCWCRTATCAVRPPT